MHVVSGVVVGPNQLSRKFSVRHNQRHANTHILGHLSHRNAASHSVDSEHFLYKQ